MSDNQSPPSTRGTPPDGKPVPSAGPSKMTRVALRKSRQPLERISHLFDEMEAAQALPAQPPLTYEQLSASQEELETLLRGKSTSISTEPPAPIVPATPKTSIAGIPPSQTLGVLAKVEQAPDGDDEQILPATTIMTPLGLESMQHRKPVIQDAADSQPAILAYSQTLPSAAETTETTSALVFEVIAQDPSRSWSEDEINLVEQVTDQLSLALENARLFQESRNRAEQLAVLNEMSRQLSSQLKLDEVLDTVYRYSSRLLDTTDFFIALYDEKTSTVSFPLSVNDNQPAPVPPRPLGNGLTDYILRNRKPLLFSENVVEQMESLGVDFVPHGDDIPPLSWLGVPMLYGDHVTGSIVVQTIVSANLYQETERDLLEAIASQAAVAIENARLFEQTHNALNSLEVSERYQKSIAQAVANLTERGIATLSDILRLLGEAALASRAFYFETQVDQRGLYWRLITEWTAPNVPSQLSNPLVKRLAVSSAPEWADQLRSQGFFVNLRNQSQGQVKDLFESMDSKSMLLLAVQGRHEQPGFLAFEESFYERIWNSDEISALQTAAASLSNTIAREDLFTQLQINLADSEALYQASARLNSAASYDDIMSVLRQHTIIGQVNVSHISLNLFDRPWTPTEKPELFIPIATWPESSASENPATDLALEHQSGAFSFLQPDRATVIMDAANDPRLDDVGRAKFVELLGAKSILAIPLNVAGKWIGHVISVYRQITGFPEQDIRRLMSLSGQAAVAVQNLQSIELATQRAREAQNRSEELATINQITNASIRTLDMDEAINEILNRVLEATGFDAGLVSMLDLHSGRLILAAQKNLPEQMANTLYSQGLGGSACELVLRLGKLISVPNLSDIPEELLHWKSVFEPTISAGFQAYLGTMLESKGKRLGTLCFFHHLPRQVNAAQLSLVQAIAQQASVVVDNARLFQQTQTALSETEALYQATSEFTAAQTYDDILQTLRRHSALGQVDFFIGLNLFDQPWMGDVEVEMPEKVKVVARWNRLPEDAPARQRSSIYSLKDFPAAKRWLHPDKVTYIDDIKNFSDPDKSAQALFLDEFKASSTLFLPLTVGGAWIGFINAVYGEAPHLTDEVLRRLDVFADQAAIATQNLRQFQEIEARAHYEHLTREIGTQISASINRETILRTTAQSISQALDVPFVLVSILLTSDLAKGSEALSQKMGFLFDRMNERFISADDPKVEEVKESAKARLSVPITLRTDTVGIIEVYDTVRIRDWIENETALLGTVSFQVALAVDNARLFLETQSALTVAENLYQASGAFQSSRTIEDILTILRNFTVLGKATYNISIDIFDRPWVDEDIPGWVTSVARWGSLPSELVSERYPLSAFLSASQFLNPSSVTVIEDIQHDHRLDENTRLFLSEHLKAKTALYAPLVVSGQWIGYLNALFDAPASFTEEDIRRLAALAGQTAVALQNLRLLDETLRRATQLQTAAEIARDTSGTLALDNLLNRAVNLLRDRFGYYHASIFLIDEEGVNVAVQESTGAAGEEMKRRGHKLPVGSRSVIGQVTYNGQSVLLNDVTLEEARSIHRFNPLLPNTRSELGIPLKIGERVIGALDVQSDRTNAFSEDDVTVLQTLADQVAVAVDNARAYELAQKAVEDIREADRLKSQFLANMSHELRTPLNSIIGFSRVILKGIDGPVNDQQQQDLTAIYNSGQHLLGLINDVLDLSRIEAGKMDLAFEDNINLVDIIKGVMSTTIGLVKDKPIKLHQVIDPDLPTVRADPMKIRQVLLNLLSNAAKFTESGSITVEARQQTGAEANEEVLIRVIDTGPGISPEDQVKLFQPFSQVDGSLTRKTGGSGLGLSISHHLIRLHGGKIGLESQIGKGTTFFFTLPVLGPSELINDQEELAAEINQPEMPDVRRWQEENGGYPISQPRASEYTRTSIQQPEAGTAILAVDEDPQIIEIYRRYIEAAFGNDFSVVGLTELNKVQEVVSSLKPFAVMLDVEIRSSQNGWDGWKVLRALKTDPQTEPIPVIVCTLVDEKARAFQEGAAVYLQKPILEDDLVQAIHQLEDEAPESPTSTEKEA